MYLSVFAQAHSKAVTFWKAFVLRRWDSGKNFLHNQTSLTLLQMEGLKATKADERRAYGQSTRTLVVNRTWYNSNFLSFFIFSFIHSVIYLFFHFHYPGIQCPVLTAPDHGNMTGDSFTFKDTVEFDCDKGYLLTGSAVRECLNTGKWDGTPPVCKRTLLKRGLSNSPP